MLFPEQSPYADEVALHCMLCFIDKQFIGIRVLVNFLYSTSLSNVLIAFLFLCEFLFQSANITQIFNHSSDQIFFF